MRKQKYIMWLLIAICLCGCANINTVDSSDGEENGKTGSSEAVKKMATLDEVRAEAENFEGEYVNLDFGNTQFLLPENDVIQEVYFPIREGTDWEEMEQKLLQTVQEFSGGMALLDNLFYAYMDTSGEEWEWVFAPAAECTKEEKANANELIYNDGGHYSALLYLSSFMMEIGNAEFIAGINAQLGHSFSDAASIFGVRGTGTVVKSYQLPEDDVSGISYHLTNGEISVEEAIGIAEAYVERNYDFIGSEYLSYQVYQVDVCQLEGDTYYYEFKLAAIYDEIVLSTDGFYFEGQDESECASLNAYHIVDMFRIDKVDYIWSSAHHYNQMEIRDEYEELLTLETAADLLSAAISQEKVFNISAVDLRYAPFCYLGEQDVETIMKADYVLCHPVYCFTVLNPQISGYKSLKFYVDAVTGEVGSGYV